MNTDEKPFVNLDNARLSEQKEVMETILARGECPFCPENLTKYHQRPILKEGSHWVLTENQWPYENTRVHLLLIHREHAEKLIDVSPEAWMDLGGLVTWAEQHYGILSGGLGMRFGDPSGNGGSVRHLHTQLLTARVTDKNDPVYKPVRLRVG
jgi:ATP adenylyltransferase